MVHPETNKAENPEFWNTFLSFFLLLVVFFFFSMGYPF